MRHLLKKAALRNAIRNGIHWLRLPDARHYTLSVSRPLFRPCKTDEFKQLYEEISPYTLVSPDRCHILFSCARQAAAVDGDFIECGVYRGGTAMLIQRALKVAGAAARKRLLLFDTFEGMPENRAPGDSYSPGKMSDTSDQSVLERVRAGGDVLVFKGLIPGTFRAIERVRFAFAHVDVDVYQSIKDCCEFIHPRLNPGGWLVFDDYGFPSCAGGKRAVDEFFGDKREVPIVLPTGQALVVKLPQA